MNKILIDLYHEIEKIKSADGDIDTMLEDIGNFMVVNAIPALLSFKDAIMGRFELPNDELLAYTLMEYIGSLRKMAELAEKDKDKRGEGLCVKRLHHEVVMLYELLKHGAEKQKEN